MGLADYILDNGEFLGEVQRGLYGIYIKDITKVKGGTEIRRYATLWFVFDSKGSIVLYKLDFIEETWATKGDRINIDQTILVDYRVDQIVDQYSRHKIIEDRDGIVYEHKSLPANQKQGQSEYDRLLSFFLSKQSIPKSKYSPDV